MAFDLWIGETLGRGHRRTNPADPMLHRNFEFVGIECRRVDELYKFWFITCAQSVLSDEEPGRLWLSSLPGIPEFYSQF